jgi:hypothetical protein
VARQQIIFVIATMVGTIVLVRATSRRYLASSNPNLRDAKPTRWAMAREGIKRLRRRR